MVERKSFGRIERAQATEAIQGQAIPQDPDGLFQFLRAQLDHLRFYAVAPNGEDESDIKVGHTANHGLVRGSWDGGSGDLGFIKKAP